VHAATRDDSILPDVAQPNRGNTKTPPALNIMDPSGLQWQAHDTSVHRHAPIPPAGDAGAQALWSHNILHAHDIPLVHGAQLLNTTRNSNSSDPPIRHDGIVDPNSAQSDKNKDITKVPFPVISSADYETDAEFPGMFLYLHNGTLSGIVKKTNPF